ncbi:MAG: ABC transporter ATP-binding protein [Lachnospiraceae bacterium]|nr:ABC transporter ATP-binding protein [Lachnospiraceae bacterium]
MLLKAEQISKEFIRKRGESNVFQAVKPLNFTLAENALTILRGASGSGKSTLLNMLAGLLQPTSGRIILNDIGPDGTDSGRSNPNGAGSDGTDLYTLDDTERSRLRNTYFGIMPQGQTALRSFNVLENVLLPYTIYGEKITTKETGHAITLLDRLGIADLKDIMPSELSGGELRRVCIARAIIKNPCILLADEPTGDLDEENTEIILNLFKTLAREGKSILMVTHEKDIDSYADHLYYMKNGELSALS